MAQAPSKLMTVDEFFAWQEEQQHNYELVDGVPVMTVKAMTGATRRHDYVTTNAIINLGAKLRGGPCRPSTSDQSIITYRGTRRPDVLIECGEFEEKSLAATEPRVVIEVMSPSTMRYDRFQKLEEYKENKSIKVILLVDVDRPRVTVWRREVAGWGWREIAGLEETIPLPEIGTDLPLADLFDGLTFTD